LKAYIDVNFDSNAKKTNYYVTRLTKVAKNHQNDLSFVIANKKDYSTEMNSYGFAAKDDVSVSIDDFSKTAKYKFTGKFSSETIEQFVQDFKNGKLESYIKSEAVPDNTDKPVKVVVGKNFNEIVMDKSKDVLIEFYAPWCGHCKKLEPIFDDLGKSLAKTQPDIVIAKMDATLNDSPHSAYQASGYPTLFWAPHDNKDAPVKYDGARDEKSFKDWIKGKSKKWNKKDEL